MISLFSLFLFPMSHFPKRNSETVSNFIEKTYSILENDDNFSIVAWAPRGNSFVIKDVKQFEESILPTYFKHSNFSSFVRQLNMYNFHKVRGDRQDCEFEHQKFKKDHREALSKIKRKQSESMIMSQNAFEEAHGQPSIHESSEEIKKNADNNHLDNFREENNQKDLFKELQNLKKENKQLKASKQAKMHCQKLLNGISPVFMGEKFFKLITSLIAEKIQKQLGLSKFEEFSKFPQKVTSFDQVIDHVLSGSPSLSFEAYSLTAVEIAQKQTDYDFMMKKIKATNDEC